MNHETQRLLFAVAVLVAGCSYMTQPEDIAAAEEICAKRGGFTHVARYRNGGQRCIEPRCTAMKERAYAAGVGSNAGLAGPYKAGTT